MSDQVANNFDEQTENYLTEKTWNEFQNTGLFWLINTFLHVFGWCLIYEHIAGDIKRVYPARTKFRGFSPDVQETAHKKIAQFMLENAQELKEETEL